MQRLHVDFFLVSQLTQMGDVGILWHRTRLEYFSKSILAEQCNCFETKGSVHLCSFQLNFSMKKIQMTQSKI